MLYVCEMEQLKLKEEDLVRRVQEIEVIEEYKQLQRKLKSVQNMEHVDNHVSCRFLQIFRSADWSYNFYSMKYFGKPVVLV